jgi:hypothetical protein
MPALMQLTLLQPARLMQDMIVRQCAAKLGQSENWKQLRPDKSQDLIHELIRLISLAAANMAYHLSIETEAANGESVPANGTPLELGIARATLAGEQIYPDSGNGSAAETGNVAQNGRAHG